MAQANTDFGNVANDLTRAAASFAAMTSSASAFGASLQAFREFERQLVLTNAIAQGTVADFNAMSEAARNFSLVTTTSAVEAGAALQNLAQAGFDTQESMAAMTGVLLLAQATMSDVQATADIMSANIRAFGLETYEATRIANVFAAAITGSLASMDKLTYALRQVAPVAELAGLTVEETAAQLGVLFNIGLRGEQAGTALRNVIIRLVRPMGEASDILQQAGIATKNTAGEFRNLADILRDIGESDISDAQLARIFETEALAGAKALIKALEDVDATGKSAYESLLEAVTDTDRAIQLTARNMTTFDAQMKLFQNNITDIMRDIGEELAPIILSISEYIKSLIESFRSLDPETQKMVTQFATFGSAIVGLLGVLNAMALLLGGPFTAAITAGAAGLTRMGSAALFATVNMSNMALGIASVLGRIAALTIGVNATAAAMSAWVYGPAVIGLGIVAAGLYGVAKAFDAMSTSAREFENALDDDSLEFEIARRDAQDVVDGILGEGTVEEVRKRVENINKELAIIGTASAIDRAGYGGRNVSARQSELEALDKLITDLEGEFEGAAEQLDRLRTIEETTENFLRNRDGVIHKGLENALIEYFTNSSLFGVDTYGFINDLSVTERAQLDALRDELLNLYDLREEKVRQLQETMTVEESGIFDQLEQIRQGQTDRFGDRLTVAVEAAFQSGALGTAGVVERLAKEIAALEGEASPEDIIRSVLEESGQYSAQEILDLIVTEQEQRNTDLLKGIESLNASLSDDLAAIELELKEQEFDRVQSIAAAIRVGTELGLAQLDADLKEIGADLRKQFDDVLIDFGLDTQESIAEALDKAVEGFDEFDAQNNPGLSALFSGQALTDAIREQLDENTSLADAQEIISETQARYRELMEAYLLAIAEAADLDPDQLDALRKAFETSAEVAAQTAIAGLGEAQDDIDRAKERIERERLSRERENTRAANAARKKALDAIKDQRKLEDAYVAMLKASRDAYSAYHEVLRGIGPDIREDFLRELDLQDIITKYDDQIRDLQRKIEDAEIVHKGDPQAIADLKRQYGEVIDILEKAKQAEIEAADSFTEQMRRRSEALDLFVRDLDDVAHASQDTFTKVGAGIAKAFAEYNRDLVTLVDITEGAVTSMLDTITTGVGDFIFDNENAWENFKKNMLNTSREIFEGFTKALLQQSISSLTGGEGSILGNALQPSKFGSEGTPGVGSGGILGRLFPGLAGAFGGSEGSNLTSELQATMTQVSVSTKGVYDTNLAQTNATLQQFTAGLQAGFNRVVASVQSIASQLESTGLGAVGSAAGGVVNAVAGAADPYVAAAAEAGKYVFDAGQGIMDNLAAGIVETANALKIDPLDLATVISYETGGTFNPLQAGPTTQYGQHRGLIQFGEPQAAQYGVDFTSAMTALETQLGENGAIVQYLKGSGFQEGMGLLDLYSTINAGAPGRYSASDANNGGAPGTVFDKVTQQMTGHMQNAEQLLGDYVSQDLSSFVDSSGNALNSLESQLSTSALSATETLYGAGGSSAVYGGQGSDQLTQTTQSTSGGLLGMLGLGGGGNAATGTGDLTALSQQFSQVFQQFMATITQTLNQFGQQFAQALNQVTLAVQNMATQVQAGGSVSFAGVNAGGIGGGDFLSNIISGLFGFAEGGKIQGPGTGTSDSIMAMVSNGEYIVRKAATDQYLPLLEKINRGAREEEVAIAAMSALGLKPAAFADGGQVGGSSFGALADPFAPLNAQRLGAGNNTSVVNNNRSGDNINVKMNYAMSGASGKPDKFRRSATQHARKLMSVIENAKRNT